MRYAALRYAALRHPALRHPALCALFVTVAACGGGGATDPVTTPPPSSPPPAGQLGSAQVWVTTADQAKLVSQDADIAFYTDSATSLPVLAVDTTTTYQKMIGFGAAFTDAAVYLINEKLSADQRETLLQNLFGRTGTGLGLSFARVTMGASDFSQQDYTYDDATGGQPDPTLAQFSIAPDQTDKLPVIKRALAINPSLTLLATPWSPPAWMKTGNSLIGGTLRTDMYGAFSNYFVKFVQAYAAAGVPITAITVQNEPGYSPPDYPGMLLDPATRATVIGQNVGPALAAAGLQTQIWDYDHNWDNSASPLTVLADPTANRYVQGVAWHCYAGDPSAQTAVHNSYPTKDTYFTECTGGDYAPNFASNLQYMFGTIIIGTTRNWARAVSLWNLALDETDGPHLGGCTNCRGVITINSTSGAVTRNVEYFSLAHASRFVRPGAVRVASSSGVSGLSSVAFRNADDGTKALIVLSSSGSAQQFVVRPGGGRAFNYTLPAGAVATFVWK